MEYLKIRNWDKWQTFRKDRPPPQWIKLHRCLMRNVEWVSLTDKERGQLVTIWLLAGDHDGTIPKKPEIVQKLCYMTEPPNMNKFIELGFIEAERLPDGYQMVTKRLPNDGLEKSREENKQPSSNGFDVFYAAYPRKVGKLAAEKAWKRLKTPGAVLPIILKAIQMQKESEQWLKNNGQFIPHPATWLNRGSWEDELSFKSERVYDDE